MTGNPAGHATLTRAPDGSYVVEADHRTRYAVTVVDGLLDRTFPPPDGGSLGDPLGRVPGGSVRRLVVVDRDVMRPYGRKIREFLDRHGIEYRLVKLPGGERSKSLKLVMRLCREFDDFGVPRRGEPVIVIGGGAILDMARMTSGIYRRGVPVIAWPVSLVGQIDAGLGVKTAIDAGGYKNRLGTYSPLERAVIDRRFLATLNDRRLSDGLAEILKVGVAVDETLFGSLRAHGRKVLHERFQGRTETGDRAASQILDAAIRGMLGELAPNLYEDDMARPVYLGHTWSPAVEMEALRRSRRWLPWERRPALLHGEAVALDMILSAGIALDRGAMDKAEYELVAETTDSLGLPLWDSLLDDADLLAAGLRDSTRHRGGRQLAPLPRGIGAVVFADDITASEVAHSVKRQRALGGRSVG
ncbi:3-dehydroquinate synthase family protein [Streptomyces lunaelactis]|uniref:3-dehydroquinate synthase family protein n=1 Tax=Streptomyces lunaelactis TaxID=1535768 RepID=UPI0015845E8D|nr:2-epi-5-epi-valiolone synthase [Streptomyces lunaelactis]NUK86720.1 2-epi-5-epi-valiolone synthase [Streptomyces lunaelactis]